MKVSFFDKTLIMDYTESSMTNIKKISLAAFFILILGHSAVFPKMVKLVYCNSSYDSTLKEFRYSVRVRIKNVKSQSNKSVFVRYNNGSDWSEIRMDLLDGKNSDFGTHSIYYKSFYSKYSALFIAVKLESGKKMFYDNNGGHNYRISVKKLKGWSRGEVGNNVALYGAESIVWPNTKEAVIKGQILVKPLGFNKKAGIFIKEKGSWKKIHAVFSRSFKSGKYESSIELWTFKFRISSSFIEENPEIIFKVYYTNEDLAVTYWDDNFKQNFRLDLRYSNNRVQ